jgi:hypothetical protein
MDKLVLLSLFAFVFIVASSSASAWHCTDTDQKVPTPHNYIYGLWGDNGLLNGTTSGWSNGTVPIGCTGTQGNFVCPDTCDGTTLREYFCGDRPATNESYQSCTNKWSIQQHKWIKVCETKWHMVSHKGETIIFWKNYFNSNECNQVPEFGVVLGGVALVGAAGAVLVIRKKHAK